MLGIIGGTGFYQLDGVTVTKTENITTPFGDPSGPITYATYNRTVAPAQAGASMSLDPGRSLPRAPTRGRDDSVDLVFLPRHGSGHGKLPHEINYRANIFALKKIGVTSVISVSAVGSLRADIAPGHFVVPTQYIDNIKGPRDKSFLGNGVVGHVSTARSVCPDLSTALGRSARAAGAHVHDGKTYVAVDGPRFGTAAESHMMRAWGGDIVGMTAVPEVFLAREAQIAYASICIATDYDAWQEDPGLHADMADILAQYKTSLAIAQKSVLSLMDAGLPAPSVMCRAALSGAIMTPDDQMSDQNKVIFDVLRS